MRILTAVYPPQKGASEPPRPTMGIVQTRGVGGVATTDEQGNFNVVKMRVKMSYKDNLKNENRWKGLE